MDIKFLICDTPDADLINGIVDLYQVLFNTTETLVDKLKDKPKLLFNIALDGTKVVGFKVGYELDKNTFYSWLGGVDTDYRNHGIASKLMEQQHQNVREQGYLVIQTKTMNRWRSMLLLNIKNGFDVIETYIDNEGLHKIMLEKKLCD